MHLAHLIGTGEDDLQIDIAEMIQQVGGADCGEFAAAVLTSLAYGDHGPYRFMQTGAHEGTIYLDL